MGGDAGCDGGDVRRRAGRSRGVRPPRRRLRGRLPDRERHVPHAVRARSTRRPRSAGGDPAERSLGPRRRGADHRRGVRRRRAQADALAGRARRRLVRAAPRRHERLARAAGALRRASRADRDHRDRRVLGRHRPRGERHRARHRRDRRRRARPRGGHLVLAGVLRLLPDPRPSSCSPTEAAPSASPSRATSTPTCICRWWRASSSSRSR